MKVLRKTHNYVAKMMSSLFLLITTRYFKNKLETRFWDVFAESRIFHTIWREEQNYTTAKVK